MLRSMTGYGKSECEIGSSYYTIEIRTLNSKQADINTKIPLNIKEKDIAIRNLVSAQLTRGKIDVYMDVETCSEEPDNKLNQGIIRNYYKDIKQVADSLEIDDTSGVLPALLRMPDAFSKEKNEVSEDAWKKLAEAIQQSINQVNQFRIQEGKALEQDIHERIEQINEKVNSLDALEDERTETLKGRLQNNLHEFIGQNVQYDKDRFEQELAYYLEKLDINEEKVRLKNHCAYFLETMNSEESVGKKLNFIAQEILREINTIGSKANHSKIQEKVVEMKDELEKMKEQIMNVL